MEAGLIRLTPEIWCKDTFAALFANGVEAKQAEDAARGSPGGFFA